MWQVGREPRPLCVVGWLIFGTVLDFSFAEDLLEVWETVLADNRPAHREVSSNIRPEAALAGAVRFGCQE
jgi:hypothetical protein